MILKNTNADIRIKSYIDNGGEITEMETVSDARYEYKNGKYYIIYKEEALSDMRGCMTTIKVESNQKVWVKRSGALDTVMCYEKGKNHSCVYSFDFGSMTMQTHTEHINSLLTPSGGELEMIYELEMGAVKSKNRLKITVKEKADEKNYN